MTPTIWWRAALVAASISSALACGGGGKGGGGDGTRPKSWTVLVYMVADNDLEPDALADLQEMAAVGSTDRLHIVVQVDRSLQFVSEDQEVPGLGRFATTRRYLVRRGGYEQVSDLGETNMGSPEVLSQFIAWGLGAYPADRVALLFWDHGGAWPGFGADMDTGGAAGVDVLGLTELVEGISGGLAAAGREGSKLALLGFDACLMSTYEVAKALAPFGELLLASEELEPGHGWDWRRLALARDTPDVEPAALGRALADGYLAQATENRKQMGVTLSLVDLARLGELDAAVAALRDAYRSDRIAPVAVSLARMREQALEFGRVPLQDYSLFMVDLGDLLDKLAEADPAGAMPAIRDRIRAGLERAVLYQVKGVATGSATGMSVYFPPGQEPYDAMRAEYAQLTGIDAWRDFLETYLAMTSTPVPQFASAEATTSLLADGSVAVCAPLEPGAAGSVAAVTLHYGIELEIPTDGGATVSVMLVMGDQPGVVEGDAACAVWDLTALQLAQGATADFGYLSVEDRGGGVAAAIVPLAYYRPGADPAALGAPWEFAMWQMVFDATGTLLQDATYVMNEAGVVGELTPLPGSAFAALYSVVDFTVGQQWIPSSHTFDATRPIVPDLLDLSALSEPKLVILTVSNAAGSSDAAFAVLP